VRRKWIQQAPEAKGQGLTVTTTKVVVGTFVGIRAQGLRKKNLVKIDEAKPLQQDIGCRKEANR